jgi:thiol:disulfide interchange protein DsbD
VAGREAAVVRVSATARRLAARLALLAAVLACPVATGGQTSPAYHGRVSLVVRDEQFEAGRAALIGVLFDLQPGWHIYWVNPGDAGEPPRIQWTLPPGFRAGEIRWPVPVRLTVGKLVDYGYEGPTLLTLPLEVPAGYQPGAPVTLAADIQYIVCRDLCVPGRARVTWFPPASSNPADLAARRALFDRAAARLPRPMPAAWTVQAVETGNQIVLSVRTGSPETTATFFPLERDQIDHAAAPVVAPAGRDGLRITLKKSELLEKPIAVLKGLVVFAPDRAFEIAAPVSRGR